MKSLFLLLFLVFSVRVMEAQQIVKGSVVDSKNNPVPGATVLELNTFSATLSDSLGQFKIDLKSSDTFRIRCTAIGFTPIERTIPSDQRGSILQFQLEEAPVNLKEVVISAGNFETGDSKKTTVLKTFELAMIATASPDVFSAVNELPGTTKVNESEGLYVRGGSASETKAIIDGLIVDEPFFSSVPGVAQGGRFSPLMFKGTAFSSGGYSAQYGSALSSVLALTTLDLAQSNSTTLNLNSSGISVNRTESWKNASLVLNGSYYNLGPAFQIIKPNYLFQNAPKGLEGNLSFRLKGKKTGLFKLYVSRGWNSVGLSLIFPDSLSKEHSFTMHSQNIFLNSTYKRTIGRWEWLSGLSYSKTLDSVDYLGEPILKQRQFSEFRNVFTRTINQSVHLTLGNSLQWGWYAQTNDLQKWTASAFLTAQFAELEFHMGNRIAIRTGLRQEYSPLIHTGNWAPRLSLAYVFSQHSQLSLAYGQFFQAPSEMYLYTDTHLQFEEANHYILSYQHIHNGRTFRLEGYYKNYQHLVRELDSTVYDPFIYSRIPAGAFNNSGHGYAGGLDIFWYDTKSISHFSYWIAYSWLDTKRFYENFPVEAMPSFAAAHNLSIVTKYTIANTGLHLGLTYNLTSGRPYYDPTRPFLSGRTPAFQDMIFSGNYAWFKRNNLFALYFYADNILGLHNVNNYAVSSWGQRTIIPPAMYRSIFAGINITLAKHRSIMGINF
jgi:hypothetical protein